jgi:hypothetical protein
MDEGVIDILGYSYHLVVDGDSYTSTYGTFNSRDQIIRLSRDMHPENAASTLLHEIVEALNYHLRLELEEGDIVRVEAGLFQVLNGNGYLNTEKMIADIAKAANEPGTH